VDDECGDCGGSGIPDGFCDCDGNVQLGCGCGLAGPSGCNNACGSTLVDDECGVCGGSGIADGITIEPDCETCIDDGNGAGVVSSTNEGGTCRSSGTCQNGVCTAGK
jgi:hypothetical protein